MPLQVGQNTGGNYSNRHSDVRIAVEKLDLLYENLLLPRTLRCYCLNRKAPGHQCAPSAETAVYAFTF